MQTTGTILVVGRWQPFHLGHLRLLEEAFGLGGRVVIVIGSAQESRTARNPLTKRERANLIRRALLAEGVKPGSYSIVPIRDFGNDALWLAEIEKKCGKFRLAMTGNLRTASIFRKAGHRVKLPDFFRKKECNATHIRSLIRKGKRWTHLVPGAVLKYLEKNGLVETIRKAKRRGNGCLGACRGNRGQD